MSKMNETLQSDGFWSAVKRKDMVNLLELLFEAAGEDKAKEEVSGTSRLTDAKIKAIRAALGEDGEEEKAPEELDYQDAITEEAEKNSELIELEKAVRKAIEKGKYKKAKKALKALLETGITGTEIDALKKEVKQLKNDKE